MGSARKKTTKTTINDRRDYKSPSDGEYRQTKPAVETRHNFSVPKRKVTSPSKTASRYNKSPHGYSH